MRMAQNLPFQHRILRATPLHDLKAWFERKVIQYSSVRATFFTPGVRILPTPSPSSKSFIFSEELRKSNRKWYPNC